MAFCSTIQDPHLFAGFDFPAQPTLDAAGHVASGGPPSPSQLSLPATSASPAVVHGDGAPAAAAPSLAAGVESQKDQSTTQEEARLTGKRKHPEEGVVALVQIETERSKRRAAANTTSPVQPPAAPVEVPHVGQPRDGNGLVALAATAVATAANTTHPVQRPSKLYLTMT